MAQDTSADGFKKPAATNKALKRTFTTISTRSRLSINTSIQTLSRSVSFCNSSKRQKNYGSENLTSLEVTYPTLDTIETSNSPSSRYSFKMCDTSNLSVKDIAEFNGRYIPQCKPPNPPSNCQPVLSVHADEKNLQSAFRRASILRRWFSNGNQESNLLKEFSEVEKEVPIKVTTVPAIGERDSTHFKFAPKLSKMLSHSKWNLRENMMRLRNHLRNGVPKDSYNKAQALTYKKISSVDVLKSSASLAANLHIAKNHLTANLSVESYDSDLLYYLNNNNDLTGALLFILENDLEDEFFFGNYDNQLNDGPTEMQTQKPQDSIIYSKLDDLPDELASLCLTSDGSLDHSIDRYL